MARYRIAPTVLIAIAALTSFSAVDSAELSNQGYLKDARRQVAKLITDHFTRCPNGDYYTTTTSIIYQVRGLKFEVKADRNYMPLDEADRANGYQWRGGFTVSARMTRQYERGSWHDWGAQLFYSYPLSYAIDLIHNEWDVTQIYESFRPIECSLIPSG
jgi:hypothetical protein